MKKKLGDLCDIVRGSSPRPKGDDRYYGGNIPRLMVSDLTRDGMYVTPQIDFLTEAGAKLSRPMSAGDVIIAVSGNPGLPAILKTDACIHDGFVGLRNLNKTIYSEYLYYYLFYNKYLINSMAVGSIFKNLTTDQIKNITIPFQDFTTQQKVAQILSAADNARRLRNSANALTDQFLQSTFLSMFGDPVTNPKGWNVKDIVEIATKVTDGTHHSPVNLPNGEFLYITAKNIKKGGIDLSNISYISETDHKNIVSRCNPEYGDLLYIKDGATTGISTINHLKVPFSLLSSVALIKCNRKEIVPEFLNAYLNQTSVYRFIRELMGGAAITRLTIQKIKKIPVIIPPLKIQQQFAEIVAETELLRQKQQAHEQELEQLFKGLLQRHFG